MTTPIIPTVGRKVWFFEYGGQAEPIDATIIKVWGNYPTACVNLDVVDPLTGEHRFVASVMVGNETSVGWHYRWMPYQQGQAAEEASAT